MPNNCSLSALKQCRRPLRRFFIMCQCVSRCVKWANVSLLAQKHKNLCNKDTRASALFLAGKRRPALYLYLVLICVKATQMIESARFYTFVHVYTRFYTIYCAIIKLTVEWRVQAGRNPSSVSFLETEALFIFSDIRLKQKRR